MKRKIGMIGLLSLVLMTAVPAARAADSVEGYVYKLVPKDDTLWLEYSGDLGDEVIYSKTTVFGGGIRGPEDLREGQWLVVEGTQDPFFQEWTAEKITPVKEKSKKDMPGTA